MPSSIGSIGSTGAPASEEIAEEEEEAQYDFATTHTDTIEGRDSFAENSKFVRNVSSRFLRSQSSNEPSKFLRSQSRRRMRGSVSEEELLEHVKKEESEQQAMDEISQKNKKYCEYQIRVIAAFLLIEVLDVVIDQVSFIRFVAYHGIIEENSNPYKLPEMSDWYGIFYCIAVILATLSSAYIIKTKIDSIKRYKAVKEGDVGVKSAKLHARKLRKAAATRSSKISPEKNKSFVNKVLPGFNDREALLANDSNIELFIEQSTIRLQHHQSMIYAAFFEDLLVLLVALYRRYSIKYYIHSYSVRDQCLMDDGDVYHCLFTNMDSTLTDVQILFSLVSFVYKVGFYRDMQNQKRRIELKKMELDSLIADQTSVLDEFAGVSAREIRRCLAVRQLLGDQVVEFPEHVTSDVNILRYVRDQKLDQFKAYQKMNKMLIWRRDNGIDEMSVELLRTDYANEPMVEMFRGNFLPFLGYDVESNLLTGYYSGDFSNIIKSQHLESEFNPKKFTDRFNQHLEWYSMILHYQSIKHRKIVYSRGIHFVKNLSIDALRFGRHATRMTDSMESNFTGQSKGLGMVGVSKTVHKALHLFVSQMNEATREKVKFVSKSDPDVCIKLGVPRDVLPRYLGGQRVTGPNDDPKCIDGLPLFPISHWLGQFNELQLFRGVSSEELQALKDLKSRCEVESLDIRWYDDPVENDVNLLRFVKRYRQDLDKTTQALQVACKWREDNNYAAIQQHLLSTGLCYARIPRFDDMVSCWGRSNFWLGEDKQGDMLQLVLNASYCKPKMLCQAFSVEECTEIFLFIYELNCMLINKYSVKQRRIVKARQIHSARGGRTEFLKLVPYCKSLANAVDITYPYIGKTVITNISMLASGLVNSSLAAFSPESRKKTLLLSKSKYDMTRLFAEVDESVVPVSMGGRNQIELPDGTVDLDCTAVDNDVLYRKLM